jgi:hypothetical protein
MRRDHAEKFRVTRINIDPQQNTLVTVPKRESLSIETDPYDADVTIRQKG